MKKKYEAAKVSPLFIEEELLNGDIIVGSNEKDDGDIELPEDSFLN